MTTVNSLMEPRTIHISDLDSESLSDGSFTKHEWKRKTPYILRFAKRGESKPKEYEIGEFNRMTGVEYLPQLAFQDEKTSRRIQEQCSYASQKGYIDSKRKWLGALYANEVRSGYVAEVFIRWIDETLEYGLFNEEEIPAWNFIGEYTGVVRRHYPIIGKISDYCFLYPTSRYFYGKHLLDSQHRGNEIRYANHSDNPNCEITGIFCDGLFHLILRSIEDIPAHTQLTYDYGGRYWRWRPRVRNA
ncbi:MAG TPA: SET domain-containing protein [Acidobacteriota bacterium]|nr:SET domain-containing protein [Acidobacteriota bacterium]